jgi:hypothetical protein
MGTTYHWIAGNGFWNTVTDWNPNGTPGASDDAVLDAGGTYTVTTTPSDNVNNLTLTAGATLAIADATSLTVNGTTISNAGTIGLDSAGSTTELVINSANVTLSGGGAVTLTDNANNLIFGAVATDTLTTDNTISGAGQLGDGQLTLVNQSGGTINGSGTSNALVLNTGSGSGSFSNAGTIEATGAGGLAIVNSTGTNTGTIEGLTNSTLTINNSTITNTNGTVQAVGSSAGHGQQCQHVPGRRWLRADAGLDREQHRHALGRVSRQHHRTHHRRQWCDAERRLRRYADRQRQQPHFWCGRHRHADHQQHDFGRRPVGRYPADARAPRTMTIFRRIDRWRGGTVILAHSLS